MIDSKSCHKASLFSQQLERERVWSLDLTSFFKRPKFAVFKWFEFKFKIWRFDWFLTKVISCLKHCSLRPQFSKLSLNKELFYSLQIVSKMFSSLFWLRFKTASSLRVWSIDLISFEHLFVRSFLVRFKYTI